MILAKQSGFVIIWTLLILPFLLAITGALIASILIIREYSFTQHQCRSSLLDVQQQLIPQFQKIIQLNTEAKLARTQMKLAKVSLVIAMASGNLATIAEAKAQLIKAQVYQSKIIAQQLSIISNAKLKTYIQLTKHEQYSFLAYKNHRTQLNLHLDIPNFSMQLPTPKFSIVPTDTLLPPIFKLSPNFEKKQAMTINWKLKLQITNLQWLHHWLPMEFIINGNCSSTIKKENETWLPILGKGKYSWNSSTPYFH